jgi:hypothetical protein
MWLLGSSNKPSKELTIAIFIKITGKNAGLHYAIDAVMRESKRVLLATLHS